ncbi:MAG: hypothetical protein KDE51_02010 [Anaerolineales bacterium]|nr:hypothetical protein [Anaerolineales bacterium]
MDPLTHLLTTRKIIGRGKNTQTAGLIADAPFYLCYPAWVASNGRLKESISSGDWPDPPRWLWLLHNIFHSIPIILLGGVLWRLMSGKWPRNILGAWLLHIFIDIPTHSREPWGPRVLWPFSNFAMDGWSWADTLAAFVAKRSRG